VCGTVLTSLVNLSPTLERGFEISPLPRVKVFPFPSPTLGREKERWEGGWG